MSDVDKFEGLPYLQALKPQQRRVNFKSDQSVGHAVNALDLVPEVVFQQYENVEVREDDVEERSFLNEMYAHLRKETEYNKDLVDMGLGMSWDQHTALLKEKSDTFVRTVTRKMTEMLTFKLQAIEKDEAMTLTQMQREVRDTLRFYHKNEGGMYDLTQRLREYDAKVTVLENEREDLRKKQQQIIKMYGVLGSVFDEETEEGGTAREEKSVTHSDEQVAEKQRKQRLKELREILIVHNQTVRTLRTEILEKKRKIAEEQEKMRADIEVDDPATCFV